MDLDEMTYALAKQVPDMLGRGFVIGTSYGELTINADDGREIAEAVKAVLERKLEVLKHGA